MIPLGRRGESWSCGSTKLVGPTGRFFIGQQVQSLNLFDVDETAAPDGRMHSSMIFLLWIPFTRTRLILAKEDT